MDLRAPPPTARRLLLTAAAALLLVTLAAGANAVMDTLSFRYERSLFARCGAPAGWCDPRLSWRNKWRDGDPAKGEAFPFSSTALVATTDAWHLAKSAMLAAAFAALLAPWTLLLRLPWWGWLGAFAGLHLLWGLVFEGLFAGALLA